MHNCFRAADILIPRECEYDKWAVIACDQHTSEPEYWKKIREYIDGSPSTLDMFFPEADLAKISSEYLDNFKENMHRYLTADFFRVYPDCYIYVERTLHNGAIRQGIVGMIDLEYYDYAPKTNTKVFATEATVLQRVPPRIALRKIADLEFSHSVIFCDDPRCLLIESIAQQKEHLRKLYDFDLMADGGHISGYLLPDEEAMKLNQAVTEYEQNNHYLVGDGNHYLVTAKLTYEAFKESNPDFDYSNHPARYAMVELENIHSKAMVFEPIYRIAVCDNPDAMIRAFQALDADGGAPITWVHGDREGTVHVSLSESELPIEALQRFLDRWIETGNGTIDYIHGRETVYKLSQSQNTVGFLVPDLNKSILFPYIMSGKVMPKKTFSIGRSEEKRYYLEGRKIK